MILHFVERYLLDQKFIENLLFDGKFFHPFARELHVEVRVVGLVVLIGVILTSHGYGRLNHRALVPLVKAGDGDHLRGRRHSRPPRRLVVQALPPGVGVLGVPGPHPRVHIARTHTRDENQRVLVCEGGQALPVLPA